MVLERIKKILSEFNDFTDDQLKGETTFAELGLDSLDVVDLVMKIDEEFGTEIQLDGSMTTLGNLVSYIEANKKD